MSSRLILVSNRLPIGVQVIDGELSISPSAGGLATGLKSFYKERDAIWLGWPGNISNRYRDQVRAELSSRHASHPVFIPPALVQRYYEGYSNRTLWPLFHSFPMYTRYAAPDWQAYQKVNQLFCDEVVRVAQAGDTIWIHDYQLMLLPSVLRQQLPDVTIGFFLHIPFPHYDVLRLLPQHRVILESLLEADLVGFHTYEYVDAFLEAIRRVLGHEHSLGLVTLGQRAVQADVFPMGIDYEKYSGALQDPNAQAELERIRQQMGDQKLIFSVSRLDYTKGIPQHLDAIDCLLEEHPEWRGKLIFLLTVVPSREKVDRYAHLKREIDELVGRINSKYATLEWSPISYMYRHLSFPELIALYAAADLGLVLPLRDGMNLVAKEYLAARPGGVLVLSETAGAAKELQQALVVNPNSREEVAAALHRGLTLSTTERQERSDAMRTWLETHDVRHWAGRFLAQLDRIRALAQGLAERELRDAGTAALMAHYRSARRRLLLLDYDGTLTPFAERPELATPSPIVLELLHHLSEDPSNEVVIVSGRDRESLAGWLGHLPVRLVSEHGAWIKHKDSAEWHPASPEGAPWKRQIRPLLEAFVDRIPGSRIEEKALSLAWHYRQADLPIAALAAKELVDGVTNLATAGSFDVLQGNRVVEIKNESITKGGYYQEHLAGQDWDFVLAAGDDWTDESMFRVLPADAHSIKIGFGPSSARYSLASPSELLAVLERLTGGDAGRSS